MKRNRKAGGKIRAFNVDTGRVEMVDPAKLKPGPIRHESLGPLGQAIARFTFAALGRLQCPTFEQWELGFLRDAHPVRELMLWLRASIAFKTYLQAHPQVNLRKVWRDVIHLLAVNPPETPRQRELHRLFHDFTQEQAAQAVESHWFNGEGGCND